MRCHPPPRDGDFLRLLGGDRHALNIPQVGYVIGGRFFWDGGFWFFLGYGMKFWPGDFEVMKRKIPQIGDLEDLLL